VYALLADGAAIESRAVTPDDCDAVVAIR